SILTFVAPRPRRAAISSSRTGRRSSAHERVGLHPGQLNGRDRHRARRPSAAEPVLTLRQPSPGGDSTNRAASALARGPAVRPASGTPSAYVTKLSANIRATAAPSRRWAYTPHEQAA